MKSEDLDVSGFKQCEEVLECPFALQRAEMLRQFKADFFAALNHDLRSPINTQISSLEIVLADLHESRAEMREFVTEAQQSAKRHLELIEACVLVGRYCPPIQPLQPRSQPLLPILQRVQQLTCLQARTRLVTYPLITEETVPASVTAWVDAMGLEQLLLGVLSWAIASLSRGYLALTVEVEAEAIVLNWEMTGEISDAVRAEARASHLSWLVAQNLLALMHGHISFVDADSSESRCSLRYALVRQHPE